MADALCFIGHCEDKNRLNVANMSSFEWLERPPMVEDIDVTNEDQDEVPQVWDEFEDYSERFRKTLYYGRIPSSDRLSLPVTELCVKQFNDLGIGDLEEKLNSLNVSRAADITRETCASPTSLVLALLYLDRLRSTNPKYLASISSTDLFLISLMVTSKFLYDDGEEDEVFNDEWATSGQMEKKELNKLELDFLMAIDWNIFVSPDEFENVTTKLEHAVVDKEVRQRGGWTTYSDLLVLSQQLRLLRLWELLYECTLKVTAVCAVAYAAGLMTMLGTCHMLSRSSLVNNSMQTFFSSVSLTSSSASVASPSRTTSSSGPADQDSDNADINSLENEDVLERLLQDVNNDNEVQEDQHPYHHFGNLTSSNGWWPYPEIIETSCQELLFERRSHTMAKPSLRQNQLIKALFALKIGSFRDLLLGPLISGTSMLGHA